MKTGGDAKDAQRAAQRTALRMAQTIATECVGARVRMLNRATTRIYDDLLRPHGIKFSQMNILTVVTLHGPVQPIEVARLLSIEKSTLSRNVRIMEANGWIESNPGDAGNTRVLRVTRQGRRLLMSAAPAWKEAQAQLTAALGEKATAVVRRSVDRLRKTSFWK